MHSSLLHSTRTAYGIAFVLLILLGFSQPFLAAEVTYIGTEPAEEGRQWRSTDVAKTLDGDGDQVYGSAGYIAFGFQAEAKRGWVEGQGKDAVQAQQTLAHLPKGVSARTTDPAVFGTPARGDYFGTVDSPRHRGLAAEVPDWHAGGVLGLRRDVPIAMLELRFDRIYPRLRLGVMHSEFAEHDSKTRVITIQQTAGGKGQASIGPLDKDHRFGAIHLFDLKDVQPGDVFKINLTASSSARNGMTFLHLVTLDVPGDRAVSDPAAAGQVETTVAPGVTRMTFDRPGHVFPQSVPVTVGLEWAAAPAQAELRWSRHDGEHPGKLSIKPGSSVEQIKLPIESFGLYNLRLMVGDKTVQTERFARVMAPAPASAASPWGVFTIPPRLPISEQAAEEVAVRLRQLGASWVRLNFWSFTYEDPQYTRTPEGWSVTGAAASYHKLAQAMHRQGLHIMATLAQIPRELSSQPDATEHNSDAGPLWSRVRPVTDGRWAALLTHLAERFREEVSHWETWNEPNLPGRYWADTPQAFAEHVKASVAAIRAGNPEASIVFSGFASSPLAAEDPVRFAEDIFEAGVGPASFEVFSSHTMRNAEELSKRWRPLLDRFGFPADMPIWDTEPKVLIPLGNFKLGVVKNFHFLDVRPSGGRYGNYDTLYDNNGVIDEPGVAYAAAAHLIGHARYIDDRSNNHGQAYVLRRVDRSPPEVLAITQTLRKGLITGEVSLDVTPLPGKSAYLHDRYGNVLRSLDRPGRIALPIDGTHYLTGAARIGIVEATLPKPMPPRVKHITEAEDGKAFGPWQVRSGEGWPSRFWGIYQKQDPPADEPYAVELKLHAPKSGQYRVWASIDIGHRLNAPRTISPYRWRIGNRPFTEVDGPIPAFWKKGNARHAADQPVAREDSFFLGGASVWQELGIVELEAGTHAFRLELTERRESPDRAWCIYFDAIALVPEGAPR